MSRHGADPRPRGRQSGWRAAAVWLVIGIGLALLIACDVLVPDRGQMPKWALVTFTVMAGSLGIVGALVVTRQPRNAVGWILWGSSIALTVSTVAGAYSDLAPPADGPASDTTALIAWVQQAGLTPALTGIIIFMPLLFPDGRPLSRRWRWVVVYGLLVVVLAVSGNMFAPGPLDDYPTIKNPFGVAALETARPLFEIANGPGVLLAAILAVASSFLRYRRSSPGVRAQLRWFGAATGFTISMFALAILGSAEALDLPTLSDFGWIGGIVSLSLILIAIGIAVLRYRLYEIDRIISRTIGWALVTGILVAVFAGLVVGLQAVLSPVTDENTLAVAASTLLVAAVFQPLRRRVQRAVDRRFDRARYDGERVTKQFAVRLRAQVDLAGLETDVTTTVEAALSPSSTGLWIKEGSIYVP